MKTSFESIQKTINQFLSKQKMDLKKIDFVVGVSRGGLIPAALIATAIDKPLVAIYIDRQNKVFLDRGAWIKGKRILLVDDIIRTGLTFKKVLSLLKQHKPKSIKSFTLYKIESAEINPTWTNSVAANNIMPWDL